MAEALARKGFGDGDLADGQLREDAYARILLSGRERWEHKRDWKAEQTGNIAVEFETSTLPNGRGDTYPSGIHEPGKENVYWWIVEFAEDCRISLPREVMVRWKDHAVSRGLTLWCGDYNRFNNALIPWKWFDPRDIRRLAREQPRLEEVA